VLVLGALATAIAAATVLLAPPPRTIRGPAFVIDGDSLTVAGVEVRLRGVDAPELHQTCRRNAREWDCGAAAMRELQRLTSGRELECRVHGRDRYFRALAVCSNGASEVNGELVRTGFAVAAGEYLREERAAQDARRGLWAGEFEPPAHWRARHPR
jgi:endonuclease YncB( thermonuclease family)